MPNEVVINGLSGQSPFNVYLCDDPITTCVYISSISGATYSFLIPPIFDGLSSFNIKITTNNGCEITQNISI